MYVLGKMIEAVRPGGVILDLQVTRPEPRIEVDGRLVCRLEAEPLLSQADAATAAVDAEVRRGRLAEEAVDEHDACTHFADGAELVADFGDKEGIALPEHAISELLAVAEPCVRRDRCRLRRLIRLR